MTVKHHRRFLASATLFLPLAFQLCATVQGATYTWDSGGISPHAPVDGSGSWDTTSLLWSNGTSDIAWPNNTSPLDEAVFGDGGTAGAITIPSSTTINFGTIAFNAVASGNYSISGGTISLGSSSGTITLANGTAPTISSTIVAGGGFSIFGAGTLYDNANLVSTAGTTIYINAGATVVIPALDNAGSDGIYPMGSGSQTRLGANSNGSGTLEFTGAGGTYSHATKLYNSGGALDMEGTGNWSLSAFSVGNDAGARTLTLTGSTSGTGQITSSFGNSTYATPGAVSVLKTGSNTWTLSGTDTYSGSTTVDDGVLAVSSIAGSSSIFVNASAANATLKLASVSALSSTADITVTTGSFTPTINLSYSGIQTIGSLNVGGVFETIGTYSASNEPSNDSSLFTGAGSLTVTAVPEPTGFVPLAIACAGILARRRRRGAFPVHTDRLAVFADIIIGVEPC